MKGFIMMYIWYFKMIEFDLSLFIVMTRGSDDGI